MGDDGVAAAGGYGKGDGVLVREKRFASLAEMQGFVDALRGLLAPIACFVMTDPGDMLVRVGGMEKGVWEDGQVHAFLGDVAFRLASLVGPVTVLDSGSPAIRIVKRFGARTCVSICEWKDGDLVVSRYGQSVILPACSPSQAAAFMAGSVEWPSAR